MILKLPSKDHLSLYNIFIILSEFYTIRFEFTTQFFLLACISYYFSEPFIFGFLLIYVAHTL